MQYRPLGNTGIDVSTIAFGAGPVPELMTESDASSQAEVVRRAVDAGINWFDTAATYGDGRSEANLGEAFRQTGLAGSVHIATKVRFMPEHLAAIEAHVRDSFAGSLRRLGVDRVTLLQVHNSITAGRGDEPTSITPSDVLGKGGVLEAFEKLRRDGVVDHLGITGLGQPAALRQVIGSGAFATMQIPYNVLNQTAGRSTPSCMETDYGNVIADAAARDMGVFAIRVFAGGALLGQAPSKHTYRTQFFPLDLYERDSGRAASLQGLLGPGLPVPDAALRFVLSHPNIHSAIVGFGRPEHIEEAVRAAAAGPLPDELAQRLQEFGDAAVRRQ
jgi:aryl-alcohol dehydrogenase-like predicted oxidoreductase